MSAKSSSELRHPHMRIATFCETYGVSPSFTYNLFKEGKLRKLKLSNVTLIDGNSIADLFEQSTNQDSAA